MTKKSTSCVKKFKSTRCRGGKRGPVRIKADERVGEQEAVLKRQENNAGIYEDVMLYVKNQPLPGTRKRGRPRKCLQDLRRPMNHSTGVLYVPSMKQGCNDLVPILTKCAVRRNMRHQQTNLVKCIPNTVVPVKRRPIMGPPRMKQDDAKVDWPDDLKELVATWDYLPENYTREVVKWLHTPLHSPNLPTLVRNVHNLVSQEIQEMDNVLLEDKILDYSLWLKDQTKTAVPTPPVVEPPQRPVLKVMSPKVVVEAQPNHIVDCGQWSSMADNRENLAP